MVDLTSKRFIDTMKPLVLSRPEEEFDTTWKYGFDSSSDHAEYHQGTSSKDFLESHLILTAAAMLQMHAKSVNGSSYFFIDFHLNVLNITS